MIAIGRTIPRQACMALLVMLGAVALAGAPGAALAQNKAPPKVEPPKLITYVKAVYPEALRARGLRGEVVLELDIGVDGTVGKVAVFKSAGPDFDAAAKVAGARLLFKPATVGGKATPVRIRFRYRFKMEVAAARRGPSRGPGRYGRRGPVLAPAGFSSFRGQVLQRGTRRPVVSALVLLPKLGKETVTDADGGFAFGLLPSGRHTVQVQAAGHKAYRSKVRVRKGATTDRVLRPERDSYTLYRASVTAPPEPGEMSRRELSVEEIQRIPGVYGDAFKVVQNLPGVARVPGLGGQIIVRGSAPGDTQVMIEGVSVPLLYHFGGVYSVVNTDILEGIDFFPGSYPVRYGRKTGGLLQARLKLPKADEPWHGYVESNVFHTGFLLGGNWGDTSFTLAGRRSYIDWVLNAVVPDGVLPFTVAPRYYDYQVKVDHIFSRHFNATLLVLGSDDALELVIDRPPAGFSEAEGGLHFGTVFHGAIGLLRFSGTGWTARTTLGYVDGAVTFGVGTQALDVDISAADITLRQDVTFGEGPVQLRAGFDMLATPYDINVLLPQVGAEEGKGEDADSRLRFWAYDETFSSPSLWLDAVFKMHPDLEVVPGLRVDLYGGNANGRAILGRLNTRWRIDEQWTVKAAIGQTAQPPSFQYLVPRFGNPDLLPAGGFETAAGFELSLWDRVTVDLQGFYKVLYDLPVQPAEFFPTVLVVNEGAGRIYGLELLARHKPVGRFFGWIAYTLMRAEETPHPGDPSRPMEWDQTHILTAVASYKLPWNFEVSGRFRVVTGNPFTEVATAVYDEDDDNYNRIASSCIRCARLPAFHQFDLRLDRKWVWDTWMLGVYLDVQNVYNQANVEGIRYNYDATLQTPQTGLPIIPSLGLRGEF